MTNKDIWEPYIEFSGTLSDILRKLGFAAIAAGWIFRTPTFLFPEEIVKSFIFTTIYFICDILQYFVAAIFLRTWIYAQEYKRLKKYNTIERNDYKRERWLDYPAFSLWFVKTISLLVAYGFIILHVIHIQTFANSPVVK